MTDPRGSGYFKAFKGISGDAAWRVMGDKAGIPAGVVGWVWVSLLDAACAPGKAGGYITGFKIDECVADSGFPEEQIKAALAQIEARGMVKNGRIVPWEKVRPKPDRTNAKRQKAFRERQAAKGAETQKVTEVTPRNAVTDDVTAADVKSHLSSNTTSTLRTNVDVSHAPEREGERLSVSSAWAELETMGLPATLIGRTFNTGTIRGWCDDGYTVDDLRMAITRAAEARRQANDARPLNVGYINSVLRNPLAESGNGASTKRGRNDDAADGFVASRG